MKKEQATRFWKGLEESTEIEAVLKKYKSYGGRRTLQRFVQADRSFKVGLSIEQAGQQTGWSEPYVRKLYSWWEELFVPPPSGPPNLKIQVLPSGLAAKHGSQEKPKDPAEADPRTPVGNLEALSLRVTGTMWGRGLPAITEDTKYWVIRVRLESLSDMPISFGDFALQIARDVDGDPELHIWHHIGRDTYGSHADMPLADEALDKFMSLTPERPLVAGALRFQDTIPFDSDRVRLTLVVEGTGIYRGTERSWEIPL